MRPAFAALALAALVTVVAAAEPVRKSFDVPAGNAEISLREFSKQAEVQIIFDSEMVAGVRTASVHGVYEPREALDKMFEGTSLRATQDATTGALTIVPASQTPKPSPEAAPRPSRKGITGDDDGSPGGITKLAALVVTGSNIPTAADATDVPVIVVSAHDLDETGANANLLDILRKRIPSISGRQSAGNSNATNSNINTAGGSQLLLRSLATLVLFNGRRVANSGINATGGQNFVDINMIPTAAIDRVEVLTDGASAIYGSDAVGGVVNVILKNNYRGEEIGWRYAAAGGDGHYTERSAYLVAGAGGHGVNITVVGNWAKTDPLFEKDRPFIATNPKAGTTFPGFANRLFLNPSLNSPSERNPVGTAATAATTDDLVARGTYLAAGSAAIPLFDAAPFVTLLQKDEQRSMMVNASAELLGRKLVAFGDYLNSNTKTFNQQAGFLGNLQVVTVPAGSPYNPLTTAFPGVVVGTVNTPLQTFNQAKGNRVTLGLRGEVNDDWNWEGGYTYSKNTIDQRLTNQVFAPSLAAAIAGGYDAAGNAVAGGAYSKVISGYSRSGPLVLQPALDPFARNGLNPAARANVYGTETLHAASTLGSFDVKVVGMPLSLPADKLGLAIGAATRKETIAGQPDQNSYQASTDPTRHNWSPGAFFDPFANSRTVKSAFAEARIPITGPAWNIPAFSAFDLSLAVRSEHYSDFGNSTVPKFGFRWQPVDKQLTVRFTYSKSFSAPDLYALFGPSYATKATSNLFYNQLNAQYNDPRLMGVTYFSGNASNPHLKPSTAVGRSVGLVFSPRAIKGLTLSVNYINVMMKDLEGGTGAGVIVKSVNDLGQASPYFSGLAVGGIPGQPGSSQALITQPGGVYNYVVSPGYAGDIYILDATINTGGAHQKAVDFDLEYELTTAAMGKFTFGTAATYLRTFLTQATPASTWEERAGRATNGGGITGTFPRYRAYSTIEWSHHNWTLTLGNNFVTSMTDIPYNVVPSVYLAANKPTSVGSYSSWDIQASYTLGRRAAQGLWAGLRGATLTVGVNDLRNTMPPNQPLSQPPGSNYVNVDPGTYSAVGRLVYFSGNIKF